MISTESATLIGLESSEFTRLIKEVYSPMPVGKGADAKGLMNLLMPKNKEVDAARKDPRLFIKRGLQVLAKIVADRKEIIDKLQQQAEDRLRKNEQMYKQLKTLIKQAETDLQKQIQQLIKDLDSNSDKIQTSMEKLNPLLERLENTKQELIQLMQQYHEQWDKAYETYAAKFIPEIEKMINLKLTQAEKDEILELAKSAHDLIAKRYEELGLKSLMEGVEHG